MSQRSVTDEQVAATSCRMLVAELGIEPDDLRATRRVFARSCIDWTSRRRPHLAGALPAAITSRLLALGWLSRAGDRTLRVAPEYDRRSDDWLPSSRRPTSD